MKTFNLPDLGEGLPDAIVREWYVKVGDEVKVDQPIVAMETAKALVDVPSPYNGVIAELHGDEGDTIDTGNALVSFEGDELDTAREDTGTVVGSIEKSDNTPTVTTVNATTANNSGSLKATPAVRALAKRLGVDLNNVVGTGKNNMIVPGDVKAAAQTDVQVTDDSDNGMQPLPGVRKAMALAMKRSQEEVVPVTISDDADIHAWEGTKQDITVRLIRAVQAGVEAEPLLNSHFEGDALMYRSYDEINLGIAVDTPHGLFVPVIKDIARKTDAELRETINRFKQQARDKAIPAEDLKGATISLSNFGSIIGKYATPVVTPPMVAIVGIGRMGLEVVTVNEGTDTAIHKMIPISLSADHRLITGGEMARFMKAMVEALERG